MNFSIVIVSYNTEKLLEDCLASIFSSLPSNDFEVIVVDNNSSDNSLVMIEKKFKNSVKIIKNKSNIGFAKANNQGGKIAQGEYLFFLNSDTIIKDNILEIIRTIFKSNQGIGILSPQLLLKSGTKQGYAYGGFPNIINLFINKFRKISSNSSNTFLVDWVSGAALIIKKDIFNKISGFDEDFFMYFEDIDLCKRVNNLGYRTAVTASATLIHLGGQSLSKNNTRKKYYYTAQDYFYRKHYGFLIMLILKIIRWPYKIMVFLKNK